MTQAQYVEIYNEGVLDLLSRDPPSKAAVARLDIREKPDGEVFVEGACEVRMERVPNLHGCWN